MTSALIGLGGNLGDPLAAMAAALRRLDARPDMSVVAVSRPYRTPAWGKTDQPDFVNAAARLDTRLDPRALLAACLETERELKRVRGERWGPRTIDLDILDHGGTAYHDEALTLPHPRMAERAFVLVPLCEVAPDHRIADIPVAERLQHLDRAGIVPVTGLAPDWWHGG